MQPQCPSQPFGFGRQSSHSLRSFQTIAGIHYLNNLLEQHHPSFCATASQYSKCIDGNSDEDEDDNEDQNGNIKHDDNYDDDDRNDTDIGGWIISA
jgi:hypothetical protein